MLREGDYRLGAMLGLSVRILSIMENATPVIDSNLYSIYCEEFNKGDYKFNDSPSYSQAKLLKQFIYDNLFSRTRSIIRDMEYLVASEIVNPLHSFPTIIKYSLDDTMMANLTLNNAVDPIIRLKGSLLENNRLHHEYSNLENSRRDKAYAVSSARGPHQPPLVNDPYEKVTDINVNKEDMLKYINITLDRLDDLLRLGSKDDTVAEDIRTGYSVVSEYVKCLVYMLLYKYNIAELTSDTAISSFATMTFDNARFNPVNSFYKFSHLPVSSAICIYPGMKINVKRDDNRCSTTSETFEFFKATTTYTMIKQEALNKKEVV